jgi:magnesium-protoporphyrin O-methyltransferase
MRVLEIGGGIGRIQAELLATGADQGEVVELVPAYERYARELARETGLVGRTSFRIADILEEPDAVEPADIVVLNRVVCCSPDEVDLAAAAARLARRTHVLSFPRDVIWVRAGISLLNASFWLRRSPFRAYVHRPNALVAAVTGGDFTLQKAGVEPSGSGRRWSVRHDRLGSATGLDFSHLDPQVASAWGANPVALARGIPKWGVTA